MPTYQVTVSPKRGGVPVGGTTGQVLTKNSNADWDSSFQTPTGGTGNVASVFSRTGAVVAVSGDYSLATLPDVQTALNGKLSGNQTVTLSGVVTGSGATAITTAFGSTTGSGAVVLQTNPNLIGPSILDSSSSASVDPVNRVLSDTSGHVTVDWQNSGSGFANLRAGATVSAVPIVTSTAPSAGQILVGNAGGTAFARVTLTGATLSSAGALSAIANATLSNSSITIGGTVTPLGGSVLGNVTNDAQTKAAIVPNTVPSAGQLLVGNAGGTAYAAVSTSGDVTVASTGAHTIAASAVTYAKMQNVSANSKLLGSGASGSGAAPSEITLGTNLSMSGTTLNASGGGSATMDNYNIYAALGGGVVAEPIGIYMVNLATFHTLATGLLEFVAVYLDVGKTLTGVKFEQVTTGVYTANNNNKVGLYTYSGGTITLVANSTNNGALWQGTTNTFQSAAFSSTYVAAAGLYFVGLLYNTSAQTTAPTIGALTSLTQSVMSTADFTNSAKSNGQLAAQTDLPATQAMSGVTASTFRQWVGLY